MLPALLIFALIAADAGPKLDVRIPRANPKQYEAVLDGRNWRNPWIDAVQDGFWLRSRSTPQKKFVTLADLRRVLTELPVSDWPYGRVVVIQSPSIVGSLEQWRVIDANVDAARKIATALDAESWGWPS